MRVAAFAVLLCALPASSAESKGAKQTVPFVGCPAEGQVGHIDPPHDPPRMVVSNLPPGKIAYYRAENGPGVFAPAGWHCAQLCGSSGCILLISPQPLQWTGRAGLAHVRGDAVELTLSDGATPGRSEVAKYAGWLFPELASGYISEVKREFPTAFEDFKGFPTDSVTRVGDRVVTFTTPPETKGLGTEEHLDPADKPIRGVLVLKPGFPGSFDVTILRVRLGPDFDDVTQTILRLNQECMEKPGSCTPPW